MKRLMIYFLLAVFSGVPFAAVIEVDVVADPNTLIEHFYDPGDPPYQEPYLEENMRIPLPSVVLSPGDIFRVNVHFTFGKSIMVINGADNIGIYAAFATGEFVCCGSPKSNDGSMALNVTLSQNVLNTSQSGPTAVYLWGNGVLTFQQSFRFTRNDGEIIDGSVLGAFTVEFYVPTVLDGAPYSEQTYSDNFITMYTDLYNPDADKNLWEIITIPCSNPPLTDTNNDCKIDFADFVNMASEWLTCGLEDQGYCWY